MTSFRIQVLIIVLALAAVAVTFTLPPLAQDPGYHDFADRRSLVGIPSFWNLISNLPFLIVGLAGMARCVGPASPSELKLPYLIFFFGVFLTGFGSALYHLAPDNASLVWDRLPMAISFMALSSAVFGETTSARAGRLLLWPMLAAGVISVLYWHFSEQAGAGDLRPYALVQFLPMALLPVLLLLKNPPVPGSRYLWMVLLTYGFAKLLELGDDPIYHFTGWISGHSVKHVVAALTVWMVYLFIGERYGLEGKSG